ncbi:MAG TPA: hypothetical protein VK104_09310 [Burkholderiaceae bacterium]|nr:hypothetical protein [Burkholderiaceae bacterium]
MLLKLLIMAGAMPVVAGAEPQDPAPRCTTRFEDILQGELRQRRSPLEVDDFVLKCRGDIRASLRVRQGRTSWIHPELAVFDGQAWQPVDHGHHIVFRANPGRYRYRLIHDGPADSVPQWQLQLSKPR